VRRVASYVTDIEKQSRTVDVEVVIDDPAAVPGLVPGYSADIEVLLDARDDALRVPTEAVQENNLVLVLEGGRLARRSIKPGLANWQYTEITSGLAAGDRVVVSLDRAGVVDGAPAVEDERQSRAP
jgi:HlyD family secretion protein